MARYQIQSCALCGIFERGAIRIGPRWVDPRLLNAGELSDEEMQAVQEMVDRVSEKLLSDGSIKNVPGR